MNELIFLAGYVVLLLAVVIGSFRYRYLDKALRILYILLCISLLSELVAYIAVEIKKEFIKNICYQLYSVVEMIFITAFFLETIKPYHQRKLMIASFIIWPTAAILNGMFLQNFNGLNTNMLMLESFSIITMCLYFIYRLLKKDMVANIFKYSPFWVAIIWLLLWSNTFFFWAFIIILYSEKWPYIQQVIAIQGSLLSISYAGFALVFLLHSKSVQIENI